MRPKDHTTERKAVKFTEISFGIALMHAYIKKGGKAKKKQTPKLGLSGFISFCVFDLLFLVPPFHLKYAVYANRRS